MKSMSPFESMPRQKGRYLTAIAGQALKLPKGKDSSGAVPQSISRPRSSARKVFAVCLFIVWGAQIGNVTPLCAAPPSGSQITLDGSLGAKGPLFPNGGQQFQITGDLGYTL